MTAVPLSVAMASLTAPTGSLNAASSTAAAVPRSGMGESLVISSVVFALLHYSHGPDWIPLLVLAAGMGYLYQRTHRLLPSLIVHMLLNGLSMWGLWVQVYEGLGSQ